MQNELKSLMDEVNALNERFLEAGEKEDELPSSDAAVEEEKGESHIFAEMLRNSVHSAKELVGMMLHSQHASYVKDILGEGGLEQLKKFKDSLEEMHSVIHQAVESGEESEDEEEEESEESEESEEEPEDKEPEEEQETDKQKEEAKLNLAKSAAAESEKEEKESE